MRGIKKMIVAIAGLLCAVDALSCKSSQKKTLSAVDYQIDESYNPDDYYQGEYGGYNGYEDNGGGNYYGNTPDTALWDMVKNGGRVWQLIEIRFRYGIIALDRVQMANENMPDLYIIQFTDEGVSGKAAPNRYFAPYKEHGGRTIKLQPIVGTLMATGDINVGNLTESNYYWYLQRIDSLGIVNGILELSVEAVRGDPPIILRFRSE